MKYLHIDPQLLQKVTVFHCRVSFKSASLSLYLVLIKSDSLGLFLKLFWNWWLVSCSGVIITVRYTILTKVLSHPFLMKKKNISPNTNDLYIPNMDKSTGSLEEKKALPNCCNTDGNIIHVLKNGISTSVATVYEMCMKYMK